MAAAHSYTEKKEQKSSSFCFVFFLFLSMQSPQDLGGNQITGTLPDSLFELSDLRSLILFSNQLNGTISSAIEKLDQLNELQLQRNIFSGTIPDSGFLSLEELSKFHAGHGVALCHIIIFSSYIYYFCRFSYGISSVPSNAQSYFRFKRMVSVVL